jgi:hypothetical protein
MYRKLDLNACGSATVSATGSRQLSRRRFLAAGTALAALAALPETAVSQLVYGVRGTPSKFRRISTQFIAALGDPDARSGTNAQLWGLWRRDPGPRGVRLDGYERLQAAGGLAPAQWQFDSNDWWLEEHGLIMEQPEFPVSAGQYMVTGDREVRSVLTIHPVERNGEQRWELADGATLHDVTHLACRSARYTRATSATACSPAKAQITEFPVSPGASMPPVENCHKQDYAVLLVIGVAVENG